MIRQDIYLQDYDWVVHACYPVHHYHIGKIMDLLEKLHSPEGIIAGVPDLLSRTNRGFTYTNSDLRESLMVVGLTSSPAEFSNTLTHEQAHLAVHIANAHHIDLNSESFCYLIGDLAQSMYPITSRMMCECKGCKKEVEGMTNS